jgi:hypothetical protein
LQPLRRGWDFGAAHVLQALHARDEFCEAAAEAEKADTATEGSFWSTPYGKLLDHQLGQVFSKRKSWKDSGLYAIGTPQLYLLLSWLWRASKFTSTCELRCKYLR